MTKIKSPGAAATASGAHAQYTKRSKSNKSSHRQQRPIDFGKISQAAVHQLRSLLPPWLQGGRFEGREYVALNPTRADRHLGSFRINIVTGRWADFATPDKGGDPISLVAYVKGIGQAEAALHLARTLGIDPYTPGVRKWRR